MKERIVTHIVATMIYVIGLLYITDGMFENTTEIVSAIYLGLILNVGIMVYYVTTGVFRDKDEDLE